ncbi:MAG: hypothetical protein ACQET5_10230, partial [Halobacteriota archaeon]
MNITEHHIAFPHGGLAFFEAFWRPDTVGPCKRKQADEERECIEICEPSTASFVAIRLKRFGASRSESPSSETPCDSDV